MKKEDVLPKFKDKEDYERWKAERALRPPTLPPLSDIPAASDNSTAKYIWAIVLVGVALSVFVLWMVFKPNVTLTDTSYTNRDLGFTMDIPEGWDDYDFTLGEKATLKMENFAAGGIGDLLFALTTDNRRDVGYSLLYLDLEGVGPIKGSSVFLNSLASALSKQGYDTEQFEETTVGGIDIPFMRAYRGYSTFITGIFSLSQEKVFFIQFVDESGDYEEEFWQSIKSFELIEE